MTLTQALMEDKMPKTWSLSRLHTFESCNLRAKYQYDDKIPEIRKTPNGMTEHPLDRGTRIHTDAENYVSQDIELPDTLKFFEADFQELHTQYKNGKVTLEEEWAFDRDWVPCSWNSLTTWGRAKLDAFVKVDETVGLVIDYKTGKKSPIKHREQGQLYALLAFMRNAKISDMCVEFWYLDKDDIDTVWYTRDEAMKFARKFTERAVALTECVEFKPRPNIFSCRFCPYSPQGDGTFLCPFGVKV